MGGPKTLLLIDEPNSAREHIAEGFRAIGWEVTPAQSVEQGRTLIALCSPSLVIVEAVLDGISCCPFITETTAQLPGTPVVVLSSRGSISMAVRAIRSGAIAFLLKPAGVGQILEACSDEIVDVELSFPSLDRYIWEYLNLCVEEAGSIGKAARRMGIHRRSLSRMLQKRPPVR